MDQDFGGAIAALKKHGLEALPPLGIVLGSGLGPFVEEAADSVAVAYSELPGFPVPSVEGHAGRLVVGAIEGRRVALFQGRGHYYERGDANAMRVAIDTFQSLGGQTLLLTNAAGGLRPEWKPPSLVAITDHINFSGANPLIGHAGADRFVPLTRAYDPDLIEALRRAAARSERRVARGRLHVVLRPELRDARGDPRRAHARRRPRRHVDRARGHPRAPRGPERRRRLGRHQFRRGPRRRRPEPRRDAGIRPPRRRKLQAALARLHPAPTKRKPHDPAPGNHPRQARRARADGVRDRRLHRRPHQRRRHRRPGGRLRHGGVLPRHDDRRAGGADRGDDPVRARRSTGDRPTCPAPWSTSTRPAASATTCRSCSPRCSRPSAPSCR